MSALPRKRTYQRTSYVRFVPIADIGLIQLRRRQGERLWSQSSRGFAAP